MRNFHFSILITLLFVAIPVFAQNNKAIEADLLRHLNAVQKNADKEKIRDRENRLLKQKLMKYGRRASTLKYDFNGLADKLYVATSKDGKFRIYSWDTESGGSMKFFDGVYQYQTAKGKVYAKAFVSRGNGARGFYSQVFQVDLGKTKAYLANSNLILSNSLMHQDIEAYAIEGEKLNTNLRLIRTTTAMRNSVGFDYDFFSVVDRPERPIRLFSYDEAKKQLRFPIVLEDKKFPNGGRVSNRYITYRFNGKYFVKVG
ncbi:MAG: hypothetical protein ABL999_00705 [Pyrinomonadaceae bacterium]